MSDRLAIRDLGIDEVEAGLGDGSIILVDVREPHELAGGMIPGSVAMPLSRFDPGELPVETGRRIVFSCAAGVRSRVAIEASQKAGLAWNEHFAGGFRGWLAAGGAIAPGPD